MARYTVLQSGDFNAAENFGALAGDIDRNGIVSGLALSNFDSAAPSIDVAGGKTVHVVDSQTAEAELDDGTTISEQRDQVQLVCHVDSQTVSLTDGTVNELYLDPQPSSDDSPQIESVTSGPPPADAVKIGEVDTSNDTVSGQWNKIEDDGTLSFPDADAANAALSSLPDGVGVIDRTNGVLIYDDKVSAATLEATGSITDPEGNTVTSLSDPVRVTEEASTFAENNITLTNNKTKVKNGSVELGGVSSTVTRPDDTDTTSTSQSKGIVINPNTGVTEITVKISSNTSGVQDVSVTDSNGDNLLAQKTQGYTAGETVTFDVSLNSGTDYNIVCSNDGDSYTAGRNNNASTPYTSTNCDIVSGTSGALPSEGGPFDASDTLNTIKSVEAIGGDATTGDVLVSFDSGTEDIEQYDLATFQRTLDGETVTVDVEDSNGNVLKSNISQDADISNIATLTDVQLRANLSRSNTANNPTVDYLARRFTR